MLSMTLREYCRCVQSREANLLNLRYTCQQLQCPRHTDKNHQNSPNFYLPCVIRSLIRFCSCLSWELPQHCDSGSLMSTNYKPANKTCYSCTDHLYMLKYSELTAYWSNNLSLSATPYWQISTSTSLLAVYTTFKFQPVLPDDVNSNP